jgi:O-antigen/teichoic acid export membrane protein
MQDQTLPWPLVQKILRNTFSSVGRFALLALLAFLVTPYVLHQLGPVQFGVWALTGVFITIIRLADFGIARALVKFVAEWNARRQPVRINESVNTALLLLIALGLIVCLLCLGLQGWLIERVFRLPEALWPEARFIFTTIIVVAALELILGVFQALLDGLQRMDVNNGLAMLNQSLSAVATVIVLVAGYGLRGLAMRSLFITMFIGTLYLLVIRHMQPDLVIHPRYFRLERARALFGFGMNFQVMNLVVLVIEPLNKILLSRFLSLEFVTYYEIANRLLSPLISLFQALAKALYPAASELGATHRHEVMAALHRRSVRYLAFVAWPIYSLVILLAEPLITLWIGPGYTASATALQLLAAAWLVSALATPAALIVQGIGMPHLAMLTSVVTGTVSVIGSLALVTIVGFYGLIGVNALGVAGGAILMLWLFHRVVAIPQSEVFRPIFTRALPWIIIPTLSTVVLLRFYRPLNLWMLILIGLGYLALYGVCAWRLGFFDTADRQLMAQLLWLLPLRREGTWTSQ